MITRHYGALGNTHQGRTSQLNRAYKGLGADMKRKQAAAGPDCDEPQTLEQYKLAYAALKLKLEEAQTLIDEMRAAANGDSPAATTTTGFLTTAEVARKSGVAVCTIIRNTDVLGGWQLPNGDWLFPSGTTYGRRRKSK